MNSVKTLQIEQMDAGSILSRFEKVESLLCSIQATVSPPKPTVFMTREEVAEFLKVSLPTIWAWTKSGDLKSYRIGNQVRYIQSEVIAAARPTRKEVQP